MNNRKNVEKTLTSAPPKPVKVNPPAPVPVTSAPLDRQAEFGGAKGPEPTRYGDWQHKGRCTDF